MAQLAGLWITAKMMTMNQILTSDPLTPQENARPSRAARLYLNALGRTRDWAKKGRPDLSAEEHEQLAHLWAGQYMDEMQRRLAWATLENPADPMRARMDDLALTLAKLQRSAEARGYSGKEHREIRHANAQLRRMRRDYDEILRDAITQARADADARAAGIRPWEAPRERAEPSEAPNP